MFLECFWPLAALKFRGPVFISNVSYFRGILSFSLQIAFERTVIDLKCSYICFIHPIFGMFEATIVENVGTIDVTASAWSRPFIPLS
jgi:hypothetical protein